MGLLVPAPGYRSHELGGDAQPRWMATLDRIRLTGLLKESPAAQLTAGLFHLRDMRDAGD